MQETTTQDKMREKPTTGENVYVQIQLNANKHKDLVPETYKCLTAYSDYKVVSSPCKYDQLLQTTCSYFLSGYGFITQLHLPLDNKLKTFLHFLALYIIPSLVTAVSGGVSFRNVLCTAKRKDNCCRTGSSNEVDGAMWFSFTQKIKKK